MKNVFILADGESMARKRLNLLRKDRFFVAIDGAAERAAKEKWQPDLVLGDFDTIRSSVRKQFSSKGVAFFHTPDPNFTDLEKGIAWCLAHQPKSIWIAQALGRRVDHNFANLGFLKKYYDPNVEMRLFSDTETVRYCRDKTYLFSGKSGRRFAVLPFPEATVTTSGLKFEMKRANLKLAKSESISNSARLARIKIIVSGEALVVEEV